jgi:thioesterase domain-containing protein
MTSLASSRASWPNWADRVDAPKRSLYATFFICSYDSPIAEYSPILSARIAALVAHPSEFSLVMGEGLLAINEKDLEHYVHTHIPLTKAMGVEIRKASFEEVVLFAPLEPNINHQGTVFGGSASTLAILAAWCLLYARLKQQGVAGNVIIYRNTMLYGKPIEEGVTAIASGIDEKAWSKLLAVLARNRMGRITLHAELECQGQRVGQLEGEFVVLPVAAH